MQSHTIAEEMGSTEHDFVIYPSGLGAFIDASIRIA